MKTELDRWAERFEKLEKERNEALARERQLREAVKEAASAPGKDWLGQQLMLADLLDSGPAPRVFTVDEVQPLVEALSMFSHSVAVDALDHARKLGMEDKQ